MFAALALATTLSTVQVDATVIQRTSHWQGGLIVTDTTLRVDRVASGQVSAGDSIEVRSLGGAVDGVAQVVFGEDELPDGDHVSAQLVLEGATWRPLRSQLASKAAEGAPGGTYVRATTDINKSCGGDTPIDLHWRGDSARYAMDAEVAHGLRAADVEQAVRAAFDAWAQVDCSYFHLQYDGQVEDPAVGYDASGGNTNVVTFVDHDWQGKSTTQAITALTFGCQDGVILDADVLVNNVNFEFTTDPEHDDEAKRDLQNVLTHEAGHFVGFAHSDDPESTMFGTVKADEVLKRDLTDMDRQGMCMAYPVDVGPIDDGAPMAGCSVAAGGRASRGSLLLLALFGVVAIVARKRA
jgi:Matrixin